MAASQSHSFGQVGRVWLAGWLTWWLCHARRGAASLCACAGRPCAHTGLPAARRPCTLALTSPPRLPSALRPPAAHGIARGVCAGPGHLQPGRLFADPRALPRQPHRRHGCVQLCHLPGPRSRLWPRVCGRAAGAGHGRGERCAAPRRRQAAATCCPALVHMPSRHGHAAPRCFSDLLPAASHPPPVLTAWLQGDLGAAVADATSAWRPLLWWLAPPGLALAALAVATVEEPREKSSSGRYLPLVTLSASSMDEGDGLEPHGTAVALAAGLAPPHRTLVSLPEQEAPAPGLGNSIRLLLSSRSFGALTAATSFGDIASWALIGWQATYYQASACMRLYQSVAGLERRAGAARGSAGWPAMPACPPARLPCCSCCSLPCALAPPHCCRGCMSWMRVCTARCWPSAFRLAASLAAWGQVRLEVAPRCVRAGLRLATTCGAALCGPCRCCPPAHRALNVPSILPLRVVPLRCRAVWRPAGAGGQAQPADGWHFCPRHPAHGCVLHGARLPAVLLCPAHWLCAEVSGSSARHAEGSAAGRQGGSVWAAVRGEGRWRAPRAAEQWPCAPPSAAASAGAPRPQ